MQSLPLSEFFERNYIAPLDELKRANEGRFGRTAISLLARFLKRPAMTDELTTATLSRFAAWSLKQSRAQATIQRDVHVLSRIARAAHEAGLLEDLPKEGIVRFQYKPTGRVAAAWTHSELTQLYGSARTMPLFDETPEPEFWTAFVLTILETQASAPALMMLSPAAFDAGLGTLCAGKFIYRLRAATTEALSALNAVAGPERLRLFPWQADGGRPPFVMLYYRYRIVLARAGLPKGETDLFDRLRATAAKTEDVIERIDGTAAFTPRPWNVRRPSANAALAAARKIPSSQVAPTGFPESNRKVKKPDTGAPTVYRIQPRPDFAGRTVRAFFFETYVPRRLDDGKPDTIGSYRTAINHLCDFAACEVLLDQLSDDLIEKLLGYLAKRGAAAYSCKRVRATLLAIWRMAARKRDPATRKPFVDEAPLDIERVKVPKILPEAFSVEEISRLLAVAETAEETVCGIPSKHFWYSFVLALYDTGFRVSALLQLRTTDLDLERRYVKARHGTQKGANDQSQPISQALADRLRLTYLDGPRDLVFPWPYKERRRTVTKRLRLLLRRAGLPHGPKNLAHSIRKSHATYLFDSAGSDATVNSLGHTTFDVARKFYIDRRLLSVPHLVDQMQRPESAPAADKPVAAIGGTEVRRLTVEPQQ